jgi:hypothetical protein
VATDKLIPVSTSCSLLASLSLAAGIITDGISTVRRVSCYFLPRKSCTGHER